MGVKVVWYINCDICDKEYKKEQWSEFWYDEVAPVPEGWNAVFHVPEQYRKHPTANCCIACPDCQINPDWSKYES